MKVTVRDVEGSSKKWPKPKCKCDSWIEHWCKNVTIDRDKIIDMMNRKTCPYCNCRRPITENNPLVGAHVQKVSSRDERFYIVPICKSCNSSGNFEFEIDEEYLVKANKEDCITKMF